jgi:hypothetical protein
MNHEFSVNEFGIRLHEVFSVFVYGHMMDILDEQTFRVLEQKLQQCTYDNPYTTKSEVSAYMADSPTGKDCLKAIVRFSLIDDPMNKLYSYRLSTNESTYIFTEQYRPSEPPASQPSQQ